MVATKKTETFRPLGNNVLLRVMRPDTELMLPENYTPEQTRAVVVAVGPGTLLHTGERVAPDLKPGDVCVLAGQCMEIVLDGDHDLICTDAKAVAGVVEKAKC